MSTENTKTENEQYTFFQIILIWLGAGLPMWLLGWVAYPALSEGISVTDAGLLRQAPILA